MITGWWGAGRYIACWGGMTMMRRLAVIATVSALLVLGASGAAYAAEGDVPSPTPTPTSDGYTPTQHVLNLNGSTAVAECIADAPWITFTVTLTDPDNVATGHVAHLVLTDGTNTDDIVLGPLVNNTLSGKILWPGASVDAQGKANGWPGWEMQNGQLVQTTGNFAWTRGNITAEVQVNPSAAVNLHYPPATSACANPPSTPGVPAWLAATGMSPVVWSIGAVGAVVIVLGAVVLVWRRLRRS